MKYIYRGVRYFLIKSNNYENVVLVKVKGVWFIFFQNEIRLNNVYKVRYFNKIEFVGFLGGVVFFKELKIG